MIVAEFAKIRRFPEVLRLRLQATIKTNLFNSAVVLGENILCNSVKAYANDEKN